MENNEMMNAIVPTETVTEVVEQAAAPTQVSSGLKNAAIVGGIMALGAVAWEFGVKPIGRRMQAAWHTMKEKKNQKLRGRTETRPAEEVLVVDDLEEQFPIK